MSEPEGVPVEFRRLDPDLPLPVPAHAGDAGYDLRAREGVTLAAGGGRAAVPTGLALAIPAGYAGLVLPRSGLALRHGISCLNSPGLIDSGYRDEIKVILVNHDPAQAFRVNRGDRIAQLVIQRVEAIAWTEVDALDETSRGLGGFGSTGRT
jgi:dUTP pyrophosphatase